MSLNIPQDLLDLAPEVRIDVDTNRLGPRQRATLKRYLKTGVITSGGIPAYTAEHILKAAGAPVVKIRTGGNQWYGYGLRYYNIPEDREPAVREYVLSNLMAFRLDPRVLECSYTTDNLSRTIQLATRTDFTGDGVVPGFKRCTYSPPNKPLFPPPGLSIPENGVVSLVLHCEDDDLLTD